MSAHILADQFADDPGQIELLHVDIAVLDVLVECPDLVHDRLVVDRQLEHSSRDVLQEQSPQVFLGVGWDLVFLVVQFLFLHGQVELLQSLLFLLVLLRRPHNYYSRSTLSDACSPTHSYAMSTLSIKIKSFSQSSPHS